MENASLPEVLHEAKRVRKSPEAKRGNLSLCGP
jgi:hypothetical protein